MFSKIFETTEHLPTGCMTFSTLTTAKEYSWALLTKHLRCIRKGIVYIKNDR